MSDNQEHGRELVPASTAGETALDVAAVVTSIIPWVGGAVAAVLSGASYGRKLGRVREVLNGVAEDLRTFKSKASEDYVQTEDFEELLERTLRQAADERNESKRAMYRAFLVDAIASPGEPFDEQIRFLRTLEELQPDHLRVLKALDSPPEGGSGYMGSPSQTLSERLPDMARERMADLVSQLNDMRVTSMGSLSTMMTYHGAQDLRHAITPYGRRFVEFLQAE